MDGTQLNKLVGAIDRITAVVSSKKPITLVDAATVSWNVREGYNASVTLTASRTLSITGLITGDYGTIKIIQGGTGSYTLTLPASSKVANGGAGVITLSTAVASIDIATFYYDGTNLFWNVTTNFT